MNAIGMRWMDASCLFLPLLPSGCGWPSVSHVDRSFSSSFIHSFIHSLYLRHMLTIDHHSRIVFRDLKPENVAVDLRGEMRLFDFGLAKELKARDLVKAPDEFHATGLTGSRRYMSPEVASCRPYGLKSDVYSFAILLWEVLAVPHSRGNKQHTSTLAFPRMSIDEHYERVVIGGERPALRHVRPKSLRGVIEQSWSSSPGQRPSFRSLCESLRHHVGGIATTTDRTAYLSGLSVQSMAN